MKSILILILSFISHNLFGQDSLKNIKLSQINWQLKFPINTNIHFLVSQDTITQISPTYIKEYVIVEKDKYNRLSIKVKPSEPDTSKAISDSEAWNQSKRLIAFTYTQKNSDIKFIDSTSSFEVIDGLRMDVFNYRIKPGNHPLFNIYVLRAKYEGHDINIDISYDNSNLDLGKYFFEILRQSKFYEDKRE